MKFYRAGIHYDEIYYDDRKSLSKICLSLNTKYWDSKGDIHINVVQTTCHCMQMICAINNPLTKDTAIEKKIKSYANELINSVDISRLRDYKIKDIKEITLNAFKDMLEEYSIDTLIEDKEIIRKTIGISEACVLYNEELLDLNDINDNRCKVYFFDKNEKQRISKGLKISEPTISPIHYVIYDDNEEIRDHICKELISYLWNQQRICNRRIVMINNEDSLLNSVRKKAYNLNNLDGGTVILKLQNSNVDEARHYFNLISEDKNSTYSDKFTIIILTNAGDIEQYNNAIRECFYSMAFYPIINQRLNRIDAINYFKELIHNDGLKPKSDAWKQLFKNDDYTYYEIGKIYKKWCRNNYYIDQTFSQYKEIIDKYFEEKKEEKCARKELEELIGLEPVKQVLEEIIDYHKLRRVKKDMNIMDSASSLHMVFMGNPGTAKTSVARIIARLLKEEGVLQKGELIEVGRSDLVGKYVGWTAKNIKDYFQKAKGSVLFIDEAYSLLDEQKSFGDEAINTIVQEMENLRDEVIVIMAGYKRDMYDFINKNSGMKSRIQFYVDFPDYTNDELYIILEHLAKSEGMIIESNVKDKFFEIICKAEYMNGNGRSVRNIYEKAKMKQAKRLISMEEQEMKREILNLKAEDFC